MWWIVAVAIAYAAWAGATANRLRRLRLQMAEAWSGVDVQLERRSTLIPQLVSVVAASQQHESDVLGGVATLQRLRQEKGTVAALGAAAQRLSSALHAVLWQESSPRLHSGHNTAALMHELTRTEDDLQGARMLFNQSVQRYNQRVQTLPTLLVARALGMGPATYFEATDARVG